MIMEKLFHSYYVSDSKLDVVLKLAQKLYGKLFGDRGYISSGLFETLYNKGIKLVTRIKKNMKNKLMEFEDKVLLNMRGMIESVINLLKQKAQVEHTRHRSAKNFLTNIAAAIVAYTFFEKKPSIRHNLETPLPCF